MADSTTNIVRSERIDANMQTATLKTSEVIAKGVFAAIANATGKAENADDASDLMNVGIFVDEKNGVLANTTGDGTIQWVIKAGIVLESVAVTGASAITDMNRLVYPTDNQTLTLTRPTIGTAIGFVKRWISGTTCDVQLFSYESAVNYGLMGTNRRQIRLMDINSQDLEGAASDLLTSFPLEGHGKIVDVFAMLESDDAGTVAGAKDINLEIGTTDVTGGVVSLAAADTRGAKKSGTAITANNEFHHGDLLSVEQNAGTGYTADMQTRYALWIVVEYLPGA